MKSPETKALVPYKEVRPRSIDGHDLNDYFSHMGLVSEREFPAHIDMSLYKDVLDYVYSNAQPAFVFPDDVRAKVRSGLADKGIPQDNITRAARELLIGDVDRQEDGERHVTIYQDKDDRTVKVAPIIYGEHASVNTDMANLIRDGHAPLFGIHTHPNNSIFSPQDYSLMIMNDGGEGVIKGQMVLLPDHQVLAIATLETTCLEPEDATALLDKWHEKFKEDESSERITTLASRVMRTTQALGKFEVNNLKEALAAVSLLDQRANKGELSKEEADQLARQEFQKAKERAEAHAVRYRRTASGAMEKFQDLSQRMTNAHLMEFAREINVQLYMSTNRKDFYKFTA